jgi:hypothetical protein
MSRGASRDECRRTGTQMFGPLPLLHRIVIVAITLACGVLAGAWITHATTLPVEVSLGALAGGLLGLVAAYAVVHQPRPVRVTRRR